MRKLSALIIFVFIFICIAIIFYFLLTPKKMSKIIVEELKVIQKPSSTPTIVVPIASLPKQKKEKKFDIIEGKIELIPMDTSNPDSPKMTVLIENKHNEIIVLTNHPYVTTLRKIYLNKNIKLKGFFRKNVVIYGREYKSFWIEDHELLKEGVK